MSDWFFFGKKTVLIFLFSLQVKMISTNRMRLTSQSLLLMTYGDLSTSVWLIVADTVATLAPCLRLTRCCICYSNAQTELASYRTKSHSMTELKAQYSHNYILN